MLRLLLWLFQRHPHFLRDVVAPFPPTPQSWRKDIYRRLGVIIEEHDGDVRVGPRCKLVGNELTIKSGTFINSDCFFHARAPIVIGENCALAMEVMLCTISHEINASKRRIGEPIFAPISIGNGCWIGTRATILQGVTIGESCVIAAGAIVTRDCEPNGFYAGVPARRIKELTLVEPATT